MVGLNFESFHGCHIAAHLSAGSIPRTLLASPRFKGKSEGERLIPFIDQVIVKVDLTASRITADWDLDY